MGNLQMIKSGDRPTKRFLRIGDQIASTMVPKCLMSSIDMIALSRLDRKIKQTHDRRICGHLQSAVQKSIVHFSEMRRSIIDVYIYDRSMLVS